MTVEEAKRIVLEKYLGAQENPYPGSQMHRAGLIFAPFVGSWCKVGEDWLDAAARIQAETEKAAPSS